MSVNLRTVNQMTNLGGRLGESERNHVVILIEGREFDFLGVGQWAEKGSPTYKTRLQYKGCALSKKIS